ncbi:hypothetical protein ISG29_05180 [Nocardioides sp. CBS4Y-1]|uniref:Uncharacterized protein n=1 Tax=Nocardioides acrostichi TaxID=2784339 RepID=A0A930V0N2_9ACTN|nr:hypothetical protein [Nocardioides acrostichi]
MVSPAPAGALLRHVVATTGLTAPEATRVIGDVLAFHAEPLEHLVRRRHRELQARGQQNTAIFRQIAAELRHSVVAAPELSERQLRRIVHG